MSPAITSSTPSSPQARPYRLGSDPLTGTGVRPHGTGADPTRWLVPTGMAALDARLEGGLPRGHLSEVIGPRSSGRLAIVVSALAGATLRGEAVALIDPLDMFDPVSAAANHLDFQRMLWVRGEPCSSARVSVSCEYGTLQKSLDRAVKALNIVLQAGGLRAWSCSISARSLLRRSSGCRIRPGCGCSASSKAATRRAC